MPRVLTLQYVVMLLFFVAILVLSAWALIDALRRPPQAFVSAGKRTKNFWGAVLGVATVVAFLSVPLGLGFPQFLGLLSAVAAVVYLVDVKPAIEPYSRRRGPRGPSSGW